MRTLLLQVNSKFCGTARTHALTPKSGYLSRKFPESHLILLCCGKDRPL